MGGGIVSYLARGKQRIGVADGMRSPIWPGGSSASRIVVYGLRMSRAGGSSGDARRDHVHNAPPNFAAHEIATGLRGGYQVCAGRSQSRRQARSHRGRRDLPELVWFENPSWTRHVIAAAFTGLINVPRRMWTATAFPRSRSRPDFSTRPDQSSGNVAMLTHGADPTQPWTMREIDRVRRRIGCAGTSIARAALAHQFAARRRERAKPPNYDGATPIYAYRAPDWRREAVPSDETGVVHAIEPMHAPFCDACLCRRASPAFIDTSVRRRRGRQRRSPPETPRRFRRAARVTWPSVASRPTARVLHSGDRAVARQRGGRSIGRARRAHWRDK